MAMGRIFLLVFAILCLIFIGNPRAFSMPAEQQCSFLLELKRTCAKYETTCYINVRGESIKKAYSDQRHVIHLTTGLLDALPKEQIRGIFYHELAHILLRHHKTWGKYLKSGVLQAMPIHQVKALRHTHEYQADDMAVELLKLEGRPVLLDEALESVIPYEYRHIETNTHPKALRRIERIRKMEKDYEPR